MRLPRGTQEPRDKYNVFFPSSLKKIREQESAARTQKPEVYFDEAQKAAAAAA